MNPIQDISFGVVPVYKKSDDSYLFCVVKHVAGHWAFPKGHREAGGSDEQTARRELFEEVGIENIDLEPSKRFAESYLFERDGVTHKKTVEYFLGFAATIDTCVQDVYKDEIGDVEWLPYDKLVKRLTFQQAKVLAKEVSEYLHSRT